MKLWCFIPFLVLLMGASDPWTDASTQDLHGYARSLSLDIRGTVPTTSELLDIEAAGEVPNALLDEWLASPEFEAQVIAQHREMLWNQLEINLIPRRKVFKRDGIYFNNNRARYTRNVLQTHCGDFEADVDELNRPLTWITNEDGSISEGYVMVAPYWDPDNPAEVCALDAQLTEVSATGIHCSSPDAYEEPDCGCGPNLQWCLDGNTETLIEEALSKDLTERVRSMLQSDGPYSAIFTANTMYLNGASTHFFRYLSPFDEEVYERPVADEDLPDVDFLDETWVPVSLSDNHDGILTAPGWLLRHQTNRGRANRFYGAFLCNEFVLPEGGVGELSGTETPTPNLTRRQGCLGCHARLEPWAAYWGRWAEAGMVFRSPEAFPEYVEECADCGATDTCSDFCEDFYLVETSHVDEIPFLGWYSTYAFLIDGKEENPDLGPLGWVDSVQVDGSLNSCATRNTANWLLNWTEDLELVSGWTEAVGDEPTYRDLVRQLVGSAEYWEGAP